MAVRMISFLSLVLVEAVMAGAPSSQPASDPRNARTGLVIPDEGYCDQPYVVVRKDGAWVCTMTTGKGKEGQPGQHVVATISTDRGKTWSPLIDIEPTDGPEASWVVPLIAPGGRIYAFYDYNGDRVDTLPVREPQGEQKAGNMPAPPGTAGVKKGIRADMLGWYVYKYSDDGGLTWSKERYRLPVRVTACDRANDWGGQVQILWGICKPIISRGDVFFSFTKLGRYMLDNGEGWLFASDNILKVRKPEEIRWEMLPDGEHGIRSPEFGSIQEEHNLVELSNGDLYCIYRTTQGHPCQTYSRDRGHTWSKPEYATYAPGQPHVPSKGGRNGDRPRRIKTPRACPRIWRAGNGKYLFWFHNHSGKDFDGRNPVWLAGGVERDGHIWWSQPEIVLYDPDVKTRMSYPDLIEQDGRYWLTETQKEVARVHEVDRSLLEGLWSQGANREVTEKGLVLTWEAGQAGEVGMPRLPDLRAGGGFSIDMELRLEDFAAGQVILDSRDGEGKGIVVRTALPVSEASHRGEGGQDARAPGASGLLTRPTAPTGTTGALAIELRDGSAIAAWECDPGLLKAGRTHHVTVIVDGGPKIITFVVDGVLCDGGEARQFGWGRFGDGLGDVTGGGRLRIGPAVHGKVESLRVYNRYLRTSEAVAMFRGAGL